MFKKSLGPVAQTSGPVLHSTLKPQLADELAYLQAVFEIDFFQENPRPFFLLAKVCPQGWLTTRAEYHEVTMLLAAIGAAVYMP
jgi:hypothetical protein